MNPIRPLDLVRLRLTPSWTGVVVEVVEIDLAVVLHGGDDWVVLPVGILELVPGQIERPEA